MSDFESEKSEENVSAGHADLTGQSEQEWSRLADRLPKVIRFRDLCRCGDEIWIENDGQLYRLRRTKQGKLILTK